MSKRSVYRAVTLLLPLPTVLIGSNPSWVQAANTRVPSATHWSIAIRASATSLRIGGVLTLGVRAPAAAFRRGRRVYLEDLSTQQIIRVCSVSTGLNVHTCIVQDQYEVPTRRQYQAFIVRVRKGGLTLLAHSQIVTVVWHPAGGWSVRLRADGKKRESVAAGTSVTLRAVSSRPLGGEYSLEIRAQACIPGGTTCIRGGILITTCYSGTVCTATVTAPEQGGSNERYRATILGPVSGGSGIVAKSPWVSVHW